MLIVQWTLATAGDLSNPPQKQPASGIPYLHLNQSLVAPNQPDA